MLTVSEVPLLQGLIYGVLREFAVPPIPSWNFVYGLLSVANTVATYAMIRNERLSHEAAVAAAVLYAGSGWLGAFGGSVYYQAAFGPPLAWLFLTRIAREPRFTRNYAALSLVLIVQLPACATLTLATLLLVAARALLESSLRNRRVIVGIAGAGAPVVIMGLLWHRIVQPYLDDMNLGTRGAWEQLYFRADVLHFFPLPSSTRNSFVTSDHWPMHGSMFVGALTPSPWIVALAAVALYVWWRRDEGAAPIERRPKTAAYGVAAVLGIAVLHLVVRPVTKLPPLPWSVWIVADLLWLAFLGARYHLRLLSWKQQRTFDRGIVILGISLFGVLIALGPVAFAFGRPLFVGPLTLLDLMIPGLERIRVPARLLPMALVPLIVAAGSGVETIIAKLRIPRGVVAVGLTFIIANWVYPWWPLPDGRSVALTSEACPACASRDLNELPLPYQWLQEHAYKEVLMELPIQIPPHYEMLPEEGERPTRGHEYIYQFYFALDGIPRLNGNASYYPPSYFSFSEKLMDFPSPQSIVAIKSRGAKWLLVHGNRYPEDEWERLRRQLDPPPEGLRLEKAWGPVRLFRLGE